MHPSRREFLRQCAALGGYFCATAVPVAFAATARPQAGGRHYLFPQGVASADPQPDAIVFWTRAVSGDQREARIALKLQVARDAQFRETVMETELTASADHDFTVRVFVSGLEPDRAYAYRFLAPDGTASRVGRTRTAPAPDALRTLTAAVFSCQHYSDGFFSAYRRLILDDAELPPDRKIDLVVHLGDFIYEFPGSDLYAADRSIVVVRNRDGTPRTVPRTRSMRRRLRLTEWPAPQRTPSFTLSCALASTIRSAKMSPFCACADWDMTSV